MTFGRPCPWHLERLQGAGAEVATRIAVRTQRSRMHFGEYLFQREPHLPIWFRVWFKTAGVGTKTWTFSLVRFAAFLLLLFQLLPPVRIFRETNCNVEVLEEGHRACVCVFRLEEAELFERIKLCRGFT